MQVFRKGRNTCGQPSDLQLVLARPHGSEPSDLQLVLARPHGSDPAPRAKALALGHCLPWPAPSEGARVMAAGVVGAGVAS